MITLNLVKSYERTQAQTYTPRDSASRSTVVHGLVIAGDVILVVNGEMKAKRMIADTRTLAMWLAS
jgi:hypothetical protein